MKIITTILTTLETPDDQGNDWYAWATNQLSHAMIGVTLTGGLSFLTHPITAFWLLMGYAIGKEIFDLSQKFNLRALRDSLHDILFQMSGSWLAIGLFAHSLTLFVVAVLLGVSLLADGVASRIEAK